MPKNDGKTPQQRFSERYTVDPISGCWNWTGGVNGKGYAYLWIPNQPDMPNTAKGRGHTFQAYKLAWIWENGPVPDGYDLHHTCENRRCVNPNHIKPLTRREHQRIGNTIVAINARKSVCPRGHPYDAQNTYITPNGGRACKTCSRERMRLQRKAG